MSSKNSQNLESILKRARIALNAKNNSELAKKLGVSPNALSTWKARGKVNIDTLVTKCENISLDWLIYGKGTMTGEPERRQENDIKAKIDLMTQDMDEDQLRDMLRYAKEKKLLSEMKEELDKIKKTA